MAPEVGPESGGFWPRASLIPGINRRNYARQLYVVHKAGLQPYVSLSTLGSKYTLEVGNSGLGSWTSKLVIAVEATGSGKTHLSLSGLDDGKEAVLQHGMIGDTGHVRASLYPLQRRESRKITMQTNG